MQLKLLLLMTSLLLFFPSFAHQKITIAFGDALAPWVMPETNDGIIITLIREALEPVGYEVEAIYYPYARRITSFRVRDVDAACDMNLKTMTKENLTGFLSDEAYAYENFAFALNKHNYKFTHLNELVSYSLMSWQGAKVHLGGEYAAMANKNPLYLENHDQELQVKMLFLERFDVIQLDLQIFKHYRAKIEKEGKINTTLFVDKFPLFGASPNNILFHDEKVRDAFYKGLKELKTNGRYEKIIASYSLEH
ncbi:substrate-binding periplasmic protein [Colwellia hornerae]|uniref:Amino acid ABC transporter substrate-binding protein n=1 Tax=Colwellia hornerae TaxID=89402 RepID=A0A5C6Q2R7_9GAMM|nr:transporter substrate-binding domain-containing protein [Colwellia hornerae]TWX52577.1 amino acid ABC transporter substrate-binding protein [Colwellia hornerae]TWX58340.1 amino acid ABC transporter substrate-binding protein [Colwellia hornerae]TWX63156.1 amino acid ABC transporter substrate-binding protein [Colwellia hornerae]